MPLNYIFDSDVSTHSNSNTYGDWDAVYAAIQADVGGKDLVSGATGVVTVSIRNSAGIPIETAQMKPSYFVSDASNYLRFLGEKSNGYPAVLMETDTPTGNILYTNSDRILIEGAEEDALIFRANNADTTNKRTLFYSGASDCTFRRIVFDCNNSLVVTPLSGVSDLSNVFEHCKIINAKDEFNGSGRFGGYTMDHCTISNCATFRPSASMVITNTLIVNTPTYAGSECGAGSNHNATTQATGPTNFGANSVYGVVTADELQSDLVGGYNALPGASIIDADSTGTGNIGADVQTISVNAPQISLSIAGDTLSLLINTNNNINADCTPYVNGSPVASQKQTKTSGISQLTWDLTSFTEIGSNAISFLTIQATDTDLASSTSNTRIYSQGGTKKVATAGNSLSGAVNLATSIGGSESLADMLKDAHVVMGKDLYIVENLKGNAIFPDHNSDPVFMEDIGSGNYDLVLVQGEGRAGYNNLLPTVDEYYNREAKPMVDAVKGAQSDFAFYSHSEQQNMTQAAHDTETAIQEQGAALMDVDLVPTGVAWHSIRLADPTIDMWADNTHQNYVGAYVNCLSLYRYLTGETVVGIAYQPASLKLAPFSLSDAQITLIQTKVDESVTQPFVRSTLNSCDVTITAPLQFTEYTEGDEITFQAAAVDETTGDLTTSIEWTVGTGQTVMATGGNFVTSSLPTGQFSINAKVTGSDGKVSQASRLIKVRSLVNAAPVITTGSRDVDHNSPWTQVNLNTYVTDDNDELDWSTLTITQNPANAVSIVKDTLTDGVVNLDYAATNYQGADSFQYTVADLGGLVSQSGVLNIYVNPPSPPTGALPEGPLNRGSSVVMTMLNYEATAHGVEIQVIDLDNGFASYPCTVNSNENNAIDFNIPASNVIANPIVNFKIDVKTIIGYT